MSVKSPTRRRFDSRQQEAYLNLWRTYDRLRALEDEFFAHYQLTAQQYNALRLLSAVHPESLRTLDLAERLVSRAPDITRLLDRLNDRGLIARNRRPENRRVVEISITEAGRDLLAELSGPLQDCHRRQLGHLNSAELKSLVDLLQRARDPHEVATSSWK